MICGKKLCDSLRTTHNSSAYSSMRVGGRSPSNSRKNDEISAWEIVKGALTSEVFWGLNLALLLIMWYPVVYLTAIFLAEGTLWKPILLAGLYVQCVLGATYSAFISYMRRKR